MGNRDSNIDVLQPKVNLSFDFRNVVEDHYLLMFVSREGSITHINTNFCNLAGYSNTELLGQPIHIFNSGFHSSEFVQEAQTTLIKNGKWTGEIKCKDKYGNIYWIDANIFTQKDAEGIISQYCVMATNITDRKNAKEQLIAAYNEKMNVFDRISDSVISVDNDWRYTYLNKAALATHPLGLSDTLGQLIWDVHPELRETVFWDKYHESVNTKKVVAFENYYPPMGIWFSVVVYPTNDGITICYRDITTTKNAEEESLRQKQLSESIINSLPGIFYLYDNTGKFKRWNTNFESITGYSADEISEMSPLDFFDEDEKDLLGERIEVVFRQGISEVEAHLLTKDRRKIPYYFNGHLANFGGTDYLMGMGIDITERTQAGNALKESEEKYRYLFNNSPALIIIWNIKTFRILEVNDVAVTLYGYTREEFLNLTVLDLRPVEDYHLLKDFAETILTSPTDNERRTWRHLKKGGEMMYMDIASHRIDYDGGKAVLSLGKDITEQTLAAVQLKETYEDIRRLNAHLQSIREEERTSISREIHDELGQLLTGLKMDTSWLVRKIDPAENDLHQKLTEMIALIDNTVKTVRRIASDLRPSILDDLGLIAALEWQSTEFQKRTGIHCSFVAPTNEVHLDKDLNTGIFRIFQEALTNVMRHAQATDVTAYLQQTDNSVSISIHDNGVGFDITDVRTKKTLGFTGMRERAHMMGGLLTVESNKGTGTIVTLNITLT